MKRLTVVIVLSLTMLFSCTKPLDNIVILQVKDKDTTSLCYTTPVSAVITIPDTSSSDKPLITTADGAVDGERILIINKSSKKIHLSVECSYADKILEENRLNVPFAELSSYLQNGYEICSYCEKHF